MDAHNNKTYLLSIPDCRSQPSSMLQALEDLANHGVQKHRISLTAGIINTINYLLNGPLGQSTANFMLYPFFMVLLFFCEHRASK